MFSIVCSVTDQEGYVRMQIVYMYLKLGYVACLLGGFLEDGGRTELDLQIKSMGVEPIYHFFFFPYDP